MKTGIAVLCMALSAIAASAGTYILVKRMYEERANKDIAEAKEYYRKRFENKENPEEKPEQAKEEKKEASAPVREPEVIFEVEEKDDEEGSEESGDDDEDDPPETKEDGGDLYFSHADSSIRLVTEAEFTAAEYGKVTYTYYADGFLVDDFDDILTDDEIDEHVGVAALAELGETGERQVFVLNDSLRLGIEVLFDERRAMDIPKYASRYENV